MICPKCKKDHPSVVDSRKHEDCVQRRRRCPECGFRFNTVEITQDQYLKMAQHTNFLAKIAGSFNELCKEFLKESENA